MVKGELGEGDSGVTGMWGGGLLGCVGGLGRSCACVTGHGGGRRASYMALSAVTWHFVHTIAPQEKHAERKGHMTNWIAFCFLIQDSSFVRPPFSYPLLGSA